ncbi:MAG: LamG domain-containing protein, partial [Clostridia bacterium]|nr:LamG domain-containing protein [Clostridia bacterium]
MKKLVSLLLVVSMLLTLVILPASAAAPESGITFTADDKYETSAALSAAPRTIEAWVKVDADASSERLGIIIGNYVSGSYDNTMIDLEIRKNGNPYFYWRAGTSSSVTANFTDVDLRTGKWTHVAVVSTTTDAKCYINGELKQTVENTFADVEASTLSQFMIGGDYRTGNTRYLQSSTIGAVALYSDSRTATQIAADYAAVDYTENTLI